jgi:hypothetical protein
MKLDKPDMNELCADFMLDLVKSADVILEWGSGGSTICMSNILPEGSIIYSVEHDKKFFDLVGPQLKDNVEYVLAKTVDAYVNWPPSVQHYSFILVDGILRNRCLERVREDLSWDILLLHDAEREEYKLEMGRFSENKYNTHFVKNLWVCEVKK